MITRVYIDNFRCFSNFEVEPARINLLLGKNGAGKSSFVDVLQRIVSVAIDGREVGEVFSAQDLTRWDTRSEQRFEVDLRVAGDTYTYVLGLERGSDAGMILQHERVSCADRVLYRYQDGDVHLHHNNGSEGASFAFRGNRSFLAGIEERPETTSLMEFLTRLRAIRSYKLGPTQMESVSQEEQRRLRPDGSNFASWYRHLAQENAGGLADLFQHLADAIPGFKSISLKGAGKQGKTRDLVVQMKDKKQSYDIEFEALSDGQRALVVLYSLLLDITENPQTLILDEPENYVGISELQPWLQALDEALGDQSQLLLISHHPAGIDFLAPEHPLLFERSAASPVRVRRVDFDRDSGLEASAQIERGLLDGQ
ncbi:MAG: AAA family ATPase [Deltaproteobacteria bacterium]|nr:AAA family ATPase [Deltaproteobacteria bacterium]